MKILYFCLLIVMCHCVEKNRLKAPRGVKVEVNKDPPYLKIEWNEVESVDERDPVIGYKINIWEVKKIKRFKNIIYDNRPMEQIEVEEYPRPKRINGTNVIPEGTLTVMKTTADNPMIKMKGIKFDVPYQFTITAYTRNMESPASHIAGILARNYK